MFLTLLLFYHIYFYCYHLESIKEKKVGNKVNKWFVFLSILSFRYCDAFTLLSWDNYRYSSAGDCGKLLFALCSVMFTRGQQCCIARIGYCFSENTTEKYCLTTSWAIQTNTFFSRGFTSFFKHASQTLEIMSPDGIWPYQNRISS